MGGRNRSHGVSMVAVAREAHVSQKTVSRVVNDEPHVSVELRSRVQAAIDKLGFRPNQAARALVTARTMRIGVISAGSAFHGPASLLRGIEVAAREYGFFPMVSRLADPSPEALQRCVDELIVQGAEGLVVSESIDVGHPDLAVPSDIPIVSLDAGTRDRENELVVGADEVSGARVATEHLLALGHTEVLHIAGPPTWSASMRRISGWREALLDAGLVLPRVGHGDWSPASGYHVMQQLLGEGVTAVFAANDHMAIGAMRAIQDAGLIVPTQVSVVGFDDLPEAGYLPIGLTTVRQDFEEVARQAVYRLVRAIEGNPPSQRRRLVPVQLMRRESTAPPLRRNNTTQSI